MARNKTIVSWKNFNELHGLSPKKDNMEKYAADAQTAFAKELAAYCNAIMQGPQPPSVPQNVKDAVIAAYETLGTPKEITDKETSEVKKGKVADFFGVFTDVANRLRKSGDDAAKLAKQIKDFQKDKNFWYSARGRGGTILLDQETNGKKKK